MKNIFKTTLFFTLLIAMSACGSGESPFANESPEEQAEARSKYLFASGTFKLNAAGDELTISGELKNHSTDRSYKNSKVVLGFYDVEGIEIGTETFMIEDAVGPKSTIPFETKVKNYEKLDEIGYKVIESEVF